MSKIINAIKAIPGSDDRGKETNKLLVEIADQLSDIKWTLRILGIAAALILAHRAGAF
jgi:hypothetical protein